MAKIVQSRFALLKVEDDDDDNLNKKSCNKENEKQSQNAKKRSKKKKKIEEQNENAELKNLAFGQTKHGKHGGNQGKSQGQSRSSTEEQWQSWRQADEHYTSEAYEKDLQEALMQSKLEYEMKEQNKVVEHELGDSRGAMSENKDGKKKKQKDKPKTISLEEFNQLSKPKVFSEECEEVPSPANHKTPVTPTADPMFFDHVNNDVHKIIQKEKMQEEYQKHYAVESVMSAKYQAQIEKKDKEIEFLRATVKKLDEDFKQVKKRNKQLCVILAQGEMRDKAEVLMQVEQLVQVRDELTEQVTELTAEVEKEKSKVHSLKLELDKIKGSKQGGK